jgi:hypothetical protein
MPPRKRVCSHEDARADGAAGPGPSSLAAMTPEPATGLMDVLGVVLARCKRDLFTWSHPCLLRLRLVCKLARDLVDTTIWSVSMRYFWRKPDVDSAMLLCSRLRGLTMLHGVAWPESEEAFARMASTHAGAEGIHLLELTLELRSCLIESSLFSALAPFKNLKVCGCIRFIIIIVF